MELDTLLATLQGAVDAITAFKNQPTPTHDVPATVVDVKVDESDGTSETLVPEAELPAAPEATA